MMESITASNKRIARNTAYLYVRMLLVMIVTLYTSRVVLEALGIEDYGVYNAIAALSTCFVFFSTALSEVTQRYFTYQLGREDNGNFSKIFNLSIEIYGIIGIAVFLIGVFAGYWYINHRLVYPAGQYEAVLVVLFTTLTTVIFSFVFSVFESVLIAYENMKVYAWLGVVEAVMKLGMAFSIKSFAHRLEYYSLMMMVIICLPRVIIALYCARKYAAVKFRPCWDRNMVTDISRFAGWNLYSAAVWMFNVQGIDLLVNFYAGPVVNAARAIANQVNVAIFNLNNNFFTAFRPQIVKRYSAGEHRSMLSLLFSCVRFSTFLLWIISLPIILRADQILPIWLKNVPEYAPLFVKWILAYSVIFSMSHPLQTAVMATGDMRRCMIIGSNLFLLVFPATWIALKTCVNPVIIYPLMAMGQFAFQMTCISCLSRYIDITYRQYFLKVLWPIAYTTTVSGVLSWGLGKVLPDTIPGLVAFAILSIATTTTTVFAIGLSNDERAATTKYIGNFVGRLRKKGN